MAQKRKNNGGDNTPAKPQPKSGKPSKPSKPTPMVHKPKPKKGAKK